MIGISRDSFHCLDLVVCILGSHAASSTYFPVRYAALIQFASAASVVSTVWLPLIYAVLLAFGVVQRLMK